MPSTINLYQIGVWFCVGFFTGAGWAIAAWLVGRIFSHVLIVPSASGNLLRSYLYGELCGKSPAPWHANEWVLAARITSSEHYPGAESAT